ncbi:MAG: hydratase [Hyphomicrobiaceae bacterium]
MNDDAPGSFASTAEAAASLIWNCWQQGAVIAALPDHCRPHDRRAGYAAQARLAARSTTAPIGWKIAATSASGQSHIGVGGPLAGRLLAERLHASGASLPLGHNRMRVAEPEFAFRAGTRLPPRTAPYTVAEVTAAMDALIPAIEIPDSRFADFATAGEAQLIADNACTHEFVLGQPADTDWRRLDLAQHPVVGKVEGRFTRDGLGANVLGDPRRALAWLVNELSALGLGLDAGAIVTTGTTMQPLEISPGSHVVADFGALGRVEVHIT